MDAPLRPAHISRAAWQNAERMADDEGNEAERELMNEAGAAPPPKRKKAKSTDDSLTRCVYHVLIAAESQSDHLGSTTFSQA